MTKFFEIEHQVNRVIIKIFKFKISLKKPKFILNNKIIIIDINGKERTVRRLKGAKVKFSGINGRVIVHTPHRGFENCIFFCGNDSKIVIKRSTLRRPFNVAFRANNENSLIIGENFTSGDADIGATAGKKSYIKIGDNCMFSVDIDIRNYDGHPIYDNITNERFGKYGNIEIGNNVWVGKGVMILKNSIVSDNSIIGAKSLVNKKFMEKNILIAGNPAKKLKENISWNR